MANGLTVEDALNHVMAEIRSGAAPWQVREADLGRLKRHYRPGFKAVFKKKQWDKIKDKIHRLARYQGGIAALLDEAHQGLGVVPRVIRMKYLWIASAIVQMACPTKSGFHMIGPACPTIPYSQIDPQIVGAIVTLLGRRYTAPQRGRLLDAATGDRLEPAGPKRSPKP